MPPASCDDCALCRRPRGVFFCARCTSDQLQQRRTMLAALQADVAVLRKKTEFALNSKSALVDAERQLDQRMKRVELLAEKVIKTRDRLCSERLAVVERTSEFEKQSERVEHAQQRLQEESRASNAVHQPVIQCLDLQLSWAHENAAKARGEKIRELFAYFGLVPDDEAPAAPDSLPKSKRSFFRSIALLPLPNSGRFDVMPPEVVAGALGRIIHFLVLLGKHLRLSYPHPMEFNSSLSTIGNTSEGAGCHTLYPDGSLGFERGVSMLHENIKFLASTQGVAMTKLHATDLLGNLLLVYKSPSLGTIVEGDEDTSHSGLQRQRRSKEELARSSQLGQSAFLVADSQTLKGSAEILPDYSMVQ